MKRVSILIVVAAGLILTLGAAPSWAGPPNNVVSDDRENTAGGTNALVNTSTKTDPFAGKSNTGFGYQALYRNTRGSRNTASGTIALYSNTTGEGNTASGDKALYLNTRGSFNTASGTSALSNNTTGYGNTASGTQALVRNKTGDFNTASGDSALRDNTTGSSNTASGAYALSSNTTSFYNTASGVSALRDNTTGIGNTASGAGALLSNIEGGLNTASGVSALASNTTGSNNTASGVSALFSSTGDSNTASGVSALSSNTTGSNNTALGVNALQNKITGSDNIALGNGAGQLLTSGDNNIYLGNKGTSTESNTMRLGGTLQTQTFIAGIANTNVSGAMVLIDKSSGQLGVSLSSARYKRDIHALGARSRGLLKLRPVTFRYRQDPEGLRQYGLLAEEVARVYPELVTRGPQGQVETVRYQELIPLLLNELQHQTRQLAELKAQNESLRVALVQQGAAQRALTDVLAVRLEQLEAAALRAATLARR
jgi:trimeric autotransporter adhesin